MCNIDVYKMAEARENRKKKQQEFLLDQNLPLISFTLNIPGPRKSSPQFSRMHSEGVRIIDERLKDYIVRFETYTFLTGDEAYFSINLSVNEIKNIAVAIEETHKLGRIFDIDVLDTKGDSISRRSLGMEPRRCLICSEEAAVCSRSRSHTVEDLLKQIDLISRIL